MLFEVMKNAVENAEREKVDQNGSNDIIAGLSSRGMRKHFVTE